MPNMIAEDAKSRRHSIDHLSTIGELCAAFRQPLDEIVRWPEMSFYERQALNLVADKPSKESVNA